MNQLLSPKQVATAIGASESSLKRWCDQGLLTTVKTAGGHRRISVQEALRFVREQNRSVVEPRILAMPATDDRKSRRIERCAERLAETLLANNELASREIVLDLFLAGRSLSQICDEVLAVAFRSIGEKWECHKADVYQERCSCQIALRILHELRAKQVSPNPQLKAIGATIEGDQYSLPATMAEIVLRSVGWDATLLGSSIPVASMINAVQRSEPGLFWLSVSHIRDESEFVAGCHRLFEAAGKSQTSLIVGGRALTAEVRRQLRYTAFCDTMGHLEELGRALMRQASAKPEPSRGRAAKSRKV